MLAFNSDEFINSLFKGVVENVFNGVVISNGVCFCCF